MTVRADEPLRRRKQPETCTVVTDDEPCMQSAKAAGLCGTHYARARKHGDPLPDVPIRIVTGEGSLSHGYWKVPVPEELRHLTDGEPAWVSTGW